MHCREIAGLMSEYVDGCLDDQRVRLLDQHFARCESCRTEMEQLRETVLHLQSVEPVEPPADLVEKVHSCIRNEKAARPARHSSPWLILNSAAFRTAAAAGIVLVLIFLVVREPPDRSVKSDQVARAKRPMETVDLEKKESAATASAPLPVQAEAETPMPSDESVFSDRREEELDEVEIEGGSADRKALAAPSPEISPRRKLRAAPMMSKGVDDGDRGFFAADGVAHGTLQRNRSEEQRVGSVSRMAQYAAGQEALTPTVIRRVAESANWVRQVDSLKEFQFIKSFDKEAGQALIVAEIPAQAYAELKRKLLDFRGVSVCGEQTTNGVVTVVISVSTQ